MLSIFPFNSTCIFIAQINTKTNKILFDEKHTHRKKWVHEYKIRFQKYDKPTNRNNDNSNYTGNEKSSKETNGTRNKVDLSVSSVTCS